MVARAGTHQRLEIALHALESGLGDLPELAEEWDQLADGERASCSLDWDHLMGTYLIIVNRHYRSGDMAPDQRCRYERLVGELKKALPLIERLKLYPPPVPLET